MRLNSTKLLLVGAFALMASLSFAQVVEPTDSTKVEQGQENVSLGETLIIGKGVIDVEENRKTPVAVSTITKQEIQDKAVGNVEFPEIMANTPSVYVSDQSAGFGDSHMYLRGFTEQNTAFLLNGQPINGMEDGNIYWSNWSAMTEVANAVQIQRGLGSSKLAISSVGGTVNIITKATERKQGGFARFVAGNDSYLGGTVSYDTGLQGKWGFSVLLNHWQAHRKYAKGTDGKGQAYFVSVGYKPSERHNLNFMIFGAPQEHGQNYSTKSQKQWDKGAEFGRKYNTTYGYLDGEGVNLRTNYYHKPVANLNWDWTINENMNLSTVAYASTGVGGGTSGVGRSTNAANATINGEIDFDKIVLENATNSASTNGILDYTKGSGIRSSVNNHFWYGGVTNFTFDTKKGLTFNVGADVRFYEGRHFQQMVNLFGLKGWNEKNKFSGETITATETFSTNPWKALFKYADPSQRVSRDYSEKINYQGGFGQVEYSVGGFSVFAQGAVSNQFYQKFDRWNYGGVEKASEKVNKLGWNVKGGMAYSFLKDHAVFVNVGRFSRQPFLDNIFQFNTVDLQAQEVANEEITGFEAGYRYKTRNLNVNVNVYHTEWSHRFLYLGDIAVVDPSDNTTVLYTKSQYATDLGQTHKGVEIDFDAKISRAWTLRGFTSYGDWKYNDSTPYFEVNNETNEVLPGGTANINGFKVGNAAQFTFGMGTKVDVTKNLSFDTDFNYYARLYENLDFTKENLTSNKEPEKLRPYAKVDLGASYQVKFGSQKLRFRGNIKNLFNDQYIIKQDKNGYGWGLGRTWNASVAYSF
ncbi:TonB-dependent receptor plug domain-containing protein [Empedobacter sp.]|uniref:TonB-dependent receptor n=1 Tax=Empedobacter sp. TaxID=1927715 RepID=UPI000E9ED7D1|nr:TonB-dependent receptor plug domain-containing protein [Empedobacter sp.]HBX63621.1 TonB-dependent receptor [Flavobacteriaceae bacterium]HCC93876.1 TonB-dependent receptor [Flavobacteriaceae bacterium]